MKDKMEFEITFTTNDQITYMFDGGKYSAFEISDEEPISVFGEITINDTKVGKIHGYELHNGEDFYDLCNSVSGDCELIATYICNKSGAVSKRYLTDAACYEKIFILDNITINKKYRNKGIGSAIIQNLPQMLRYKFDYGSNIFLCASDFESARQFGFDSQEFKNGCHRLVEFYKKFGYRVIKDNIMVYNAPCEQM